MKKLCLMICVCGLILIGVHTATANTWQVVYQSDFSSEPGWTTNSPSNMYWDQQKAKYHVKITGQGEYAFVQIPYISGLSYKLEFDIEVVRLDYPSAISFGLYDPTMNEIEPVNWKANWGVGDGGYSASIGYLPDSGIFGTFPGPYEFLFELNTDYHNVIVYDATMQKFSWKITRISDGTIVGDYSSPTGEGNFTGIDRICVTRVPQGATSEGYIDNVVLCSAASEPEPLTGRITFISDRDGNEEIYLMNVDGTSQIRLTNDLGVDASPVFSPDGETIAFISNRSGSHRIYTMLWNGGEAHEVPNSECFLGYTSYCRSLALSPDGQKLVFEPTSDSLATINLDGSGKTILLTGGVDGHNVIWGPEWGPTMDDIYFNAQPPSNGYDQHIFHYSISGNNWTQITADVQPMLSSGPKVSRWTSRIVFFRQEQWAAGYNIFTMDLDGRNMSKITHDNSTSNATPDWCGETGEIVFWSNKSGRNQIWLMDSTGGNLRMIEGEGNNYAPSWTPISEPVEPDIDVSPLSHDFGDVELGTSRTVIVTISNVGNGDLTVSGIGLETDFAITSAPDSAIVVEPSQTADVEITYTPSALGYNMALLKIISDDPDEPVVEVQLSAVGIEIPLPPLEQIANILAFFDTYVDDGTLLGDGPGNSAKKRLNALRNMIEAAGNLIENELFEEACQQLLDAYRRMDGQPKPPDFVTGEAVTELATMIQELMTTLGC